MSRLVIVDHQRSIKGQSIYLKFIWSRAEKKMLSLMIFLGAQFFFDILMHMFQNVKF